MATRGVTQDNLGHSFTSGSDFIFEFSCEVCRHNGLNAEAGGYCPDCKMNLCGVCTRAHKRTRLTRQHDVISDGCIRAHKRTRPTRQHDIISDGCIRAHKRTRPTRHHDVIDQAIIPNDSPIPKQRIRNDVTLVKNDRNTRATHLADINVKTNSDENDCIIYGSAVLSDILLVIADRKNEKVKLVDTKVNKLRSELKVSGHPFDVAKIHDNLVAVGIWKGGKILIIKVTDTLSLEREISVSRDLHGVAYSQGKLLVTFRDSKRLDIMDIQGNIIKKLEKNKEGHNIFKGPRQVCVSTNGESIYMYVSDYGESEDVLRLTFSGETKSVCNTVFLPYQVCTDHCGYVYIAGYCNMSVHMLTADLVKIKEVLTEADGLDNSVLSVSHCVRTNRLYVGMWGSNVVKVFKLS